MVDPCKRDASSAPFLSFCLINRNSEKTVEATLRSIRERAPNAEIVVVDTMSSDGSPEICRRYADVFVEWTGPKGAWNREMAWFDDAAAARQRAFELASGKWRGWIDTDDRLAGPDEARELLKLNARWMPPARNGDVIDGAVERTLEDVIKLLEARDPKIDQIWCPYLYQREADGKAITWQSRERFVRWDSPPKFRWAEGAHEILVPVPGYHSPRAELPHLLFVHEKDFSPEAIDYATRRHWDVLTSQYNSGDVTTRRALYLAAYSSRFAPDRQREFIDAAAAAACTPTDRYQAKIALGNFYADRGLNWDALEAFSAATQLRPDLPDAWLIGGGRWYRAEQWDRAVQWFTTGLSLPFNEVESEVRPHDMHLQYPELLARSCDQVARIYITSGLHDDALKTMELSTQLRLGVRDHAQTEDDKIEAQCNVAEAHNAEEAQRHAIQLGKLVQFMLDNDEPLKAMALLDRSIPWMLKDHPIIVEAERKLAPVRTHVTDPQAYFEWYNDDSKTGYMSSKDDWLDPDTCLPRARWMAAWINEHCPNARVLDFGCFDGIIGIPLLALCPGITYVGIDPQERAVREFTERLTARGFADRAEVRLSRELPTYGNVYDVVIWSEVIEHVVDPVATIRALTSGCLADSGWLLVTTPWGSFDHGHPAPVTRMKTKRDNRGHLRAYTAREIFEDFTLGAGRVVEELRLVKGPIIGDEINLVARNEPAPLAPPIRFAVAGALWDWNAVESKRDGIGASEEMIIYLAEALATGNRVEVYGPTPREDVHKRVAYWPREHLRHAARGYRPGRVIVSRAPAWGATRLDDQIGAELAKILWLQDVPNPDLNPEIAARYEKIVCVSDWHKQVTHTMHGVPLAKIETIYNFVLPEHFTPFGGVARNPHRFVYASSPDRGLVRCLEIWPQIRGDLPDAELHVFYGWRGCEKLGFGIDAAWTKRYEKTRRAFEKLRYQPGVFVHGMVNHVEIALALMSASVWLHPSMDVFGDPFYETCCTLALKARAAGCTPVCAPYGALGETAEAGGTEWFIDPRDQPAFAAAAISAAGTSEEKRRQMSEAAIKDFSLAAALPKWREILK